MSVAIPLAVIHQVASAEEPPPPISGSGEVIASPDFTVRAGEPTGVFSIAFARAGFHATIDWDDGVTETRSSTDISAAEAGSDPTRLFSIQALDHHVRVDHTWTEPDDYTIRVEIRATAGGERLETLEVEVDVIEEEIFNVVAVGDSVSSGEGSPDGASKLVKSARWQPEHLVPLDTEPKHVRYRKDCHRSQKSGPAVAVDRLQRMADDNNADLHVNFVHLACSGSGTNGGTGSRGQLQEYRYGMWGPVHHVDALLVQSGANDIGNGFSDILKSCISPDVLCTDAGRNAGEVRTRVANALPAVPVCAPDNPAPILCRYRLLTEDIAGLDAAVGVDDVFVTEYFDPTGGPSVCTTRWTPIIVPILIGIAVATLGLGLIPIAGAITAIVLPALSAWGIAATVGAVIAGFQITIERSEWTWARERIVMPLNDLLADIAGERDAWHLVGGIEAAFSSHGYCDGVNSWVIDPLESLWNQRGIGGVGHPIAKGHRVIGERIACDVLTISAPFPTTVDPCPPVVDVAGQGAFDATSAVGAKLTLVRQPAPTLDSDPTPPVEPRLYVDATDRKTPSAEIVIECRRTELDESGEPIESVPLPFDTPTAFPFGTEVSVECDATDSDGNSSTSSTRVLVVDRIAPELLGVCEDEPCTDDQTVEATSPAGALATIDVTATDAVTATPVVDCTRRLDGVDVPLDPASTELYPLGETVVTCTTEDAGRPDPDSFEPPEVPEGVDPPTEEELAEGRAQAVAQWEQIHVRTGSLVISVVDTTPPDLVVPDPIHTDAASPSGSVVEFEATATDIVTLEPVITCEPPSGWLFPIGTTTVMCDAVDDAGNVAADQFDVTIVLSGRTFDGFNVEIEQLALPTGPTQALVAKVSAARAAFLRSQFRTAINELSAMQSLVDAQIGKKIGAEDATFLSTSITILQDTLRLLETAERAEVECCQ